MESDDEVRPLSRFTNGMLAIGAVPAKLKKNP